MTILNVVLWILQLLLAVAYVLHGWLFLFPSAEMQPALASMGLPPAFIAFIGAAEWLAAAGLVLPGLTRLAPWLTPLAAAGLMVVMASAFVFHLSRGELASLPTAVVLFALLAV
ncbi:MAG: DoxX family protein, partial [Chloroflexota bacterium]